MKIDGELAISADKKIDRRKGGFGIGTMESAAEFREIEVRSKDETILYRSSQ